MNNLIWKLKIKSNDLLKNILIPNYWISTYQEVLCLNLKINFLYLNIKNIVIIIKTKQPADSKKVETDIDYRSPNNNMPIQVIESTVIKIVLKHHNVP